MAEAAALRARPSLLRQLGSNFAGASSFIIILGVLLAAVFAPLIAPYDPVTLNPADRLQGPSPDHLAGTDQYGRDTFSRIVFGGRVSLTVAFASVAFAALIGGVLGLLSGFYRSWPDALIMRITDILLSFPAVLLAIALLAFFGSGMLNLILAIGVIYIGPFVRVARAAVFTVREELYVEADRALGAADRRILWGAIIPNAAAPMIVEVTLRLAYAILSEASLSFLGLGVQPPAPSWGQMSADGRAFLALSPWAAVTPGLAIMLIVLGFNLLGDALRDALDPRLR